MPMDPNSLQFERFSAYLRLLAELLLSRDLRLRATLGPSDMVQDTLVRALENRDQFRGASEAELKAWLRKILTNVVKNRAREFHDVAGRDVDRELSLEQGVEQSSARLEVWLEAELSSPSQQAERNEQLERLAKALETLGDDQKQAVILHYFHALTLEEVAQETPGGNGFEDLRGLCLRRFWYL